MFHLQSLLFPIMFAHPGSLRNNPDGNQVEVPEAAQITLSGHGNIKGCSNLYFIGGDWAVHLPCELLYPVHLAGEKGKKGGCIVVDAAVQLDLLGQLVSAVIHFLFDGNNVKYIQYESDQDDSYQNIYEAADIRSLAFFGSDQLKSVFQGFTSF